MLYYRYRPAGELALKELLYDEVFLTSSSECNDPYDGMPFLVFGPDRDKWRRLFELAWTEINLPLKAELIEAMVNRMVGACPLSYADAVDFDYRRLIADLSPKLSAIASALALRATSLLDLYRPRPPYFASFSRSRENTLMWSHYASMHQGHCLIFRELDGSLRQCPRRTRRSIQRNTSRGLAPSMSYGVPTDFQFRNVEYQEHTEGLDAFAHLPGQVYGQALSEDERIKLVESQQRQLLTKHIGWSYEEEVRITFSPGTSWLFGEHIECTPLERLLHFRPTQLVGLIMGARASASQQSRLREICKARLSRIAIDIGKNGVEEPLFDFVIFQAGLLNDRRDLSTKPVEILSLSQRYGPEEPKFAEHLERWEQGWALVFHGNGARKQQFT